MLLLGSAAILALNACDRVAEGDALARAQTHMAASDYAAARVELLNAARQRPDDPAVHLATAKTLLELGDPVGAAAAAAAAAQAGADSADAAMLEGEAAVMSGRAHRARELADTLPASRGADAALLRAGAAMIEGEAAAAVAVLEAAIAEHPRDGRLRIEIGHAALAADQFDAAREHAREAVRLAPDMVGSHLLRGRIAQIDGQPETALAAFDRALALRADSLPAMVGRATALGDLGRMRELRSQLDELARRAPNNLDALYLRARLAAREGRTSEAQSLLNSAGRGFAEHPQALALSAQLASAQGFRSLAIAKAQQARQLAPGEPYLNYLLAEMLWRDGQGTAALAALAFFDEPDAPPARPEVAALRSAIMANRPLAPMVGGN